MANRPDPVNRKSSPDRENHAPIRVMVVDDSLTVRTIFARMVADEGGMEVAGTFSSAERAIAKLEELPVDVILLDLEMPGMGGLQALPKMLETAAKAQVLVVSSLTEEGAEHTLAALSMGAAETMLKPRTGGFDAVYRSALLAKIRALGGKHRGAPQPGLATTAPASPEQNTRPLPRRKTPELVAIGASTGGIHAINLFLRSLPHNFELPILITQHLPASFMPVLARQLEVASARRTVVAEEGTVIRRGEIVIAPGNGHMIVKRRGESLYAMLDVEPATSGCMPSVDPMFTSVAQALKGHAIGVILSGMGRDGTEGAGALVGEGGAILAQDAASSAVWGMPGSIAKAGLASAIEPPEKLAELVVAAAGVAQWK